jgi:hypothetical protein
MIQVDTSIEITKTNIGAGSNVCYAVHLSHFNPSDNIVSNCLSNNKGLFPPVQHSSNLQPAITLQIKGTPNTPTFYHSDEK